MMNEKKHPMIDQEKNTINIDTIEQKKIVENSIVTLSVARITSFGAFLSAKTGNTSDDILLHVGQQTRAVSEGEEVTVFLYHDPHHRLTASMKLPQISIGNIGYVRVMLTTRFGAFVDVGTERGIFLPFSEMIGRVEEGEMVWVKLYEDKSGRLAVTMHVDEEIKALAKPAQGIKVGGKIQGTVYNITRFGAFIITREKWIAFLHTSEMPRQLKAGQEISGRVTFIPPGGTLNISLRPTKEQAIEQDGNILLEYMERHDGVCPYTDKSDPERIKLTFGFSKAAFKRAVGYLLRMGKITIADGKILRK